LGQFEHDTFICDYVPNTQSFIIGNSDQGIAVASVLHQSYDIQMGLNSLNLCTSFGINHNEIVSTAKGNFLAVDGKRSRHSRELNFIFFRIKVNPAHYRIVEHAADHLRLIENRPLEIGPSEGTLIKDRIREVCLRDVAIIEIHIGEDKTHL